ncbi:acyltransferase family protein [Egicoccus halophilus]|uniref:Acyltransferase 3 domain-containing protein n=1 Tax=Egicoccus halophilus TaxID=1670830 RepID=A0A8J3EVP5_9ACTN|nr:acyltransferase [Egicoccus halophilus]GGI09583.1 hypothetical protein GCM10011354_34800 [Egicoccus halophilus]
MATELATSETAVAVADGRDRVVDLVRAASLLVVALGHWLLAGVQLHPDGGIAVEHLLAAAPWTQWLTWGAQVIGLFMLAGAFANATSWRSHRVAGGGYGAWLAGRWLRLVVPTLPLVAFWVPVAALAVRQARLAPETLHEATQVVAVPVWFLAVYVLLVAATPALLAWHDRSGVRALAALLAAALVVEVLGRGLGVPVVGWLQFPLVWGSVHQLGFFWQDGRLRAAGRRVWTLLAGVGIGGLYLITRGLDLYPLSMVGVPGEVRSNNTPPSLAIVVLSVGHLGVLMLAHRRLSTWLGRPRVQRATARLGMVSMTVYLWHLTAMVAVLGVALAVPPGRELLRMPVASAGWWATRPLWFVAHAAVTIVLARAVLPVERRTVAGVQRLRTRRLAPVPVVASTLAACAALATFAGRGFVVPDAPGQLPVTGLALLVVACLLLWGATRSASRRVD